MPPGRPPNGNERANHAGWHATGRRHAPCKDLVKNQEEPMTLTLTPSLTIRVRRAADSARHVIRTHTRHLSITSLSFLNMEVLVFRYHGK